MKGPALVYSAAATRLTPPMALRYVRLSPPQGTATECCVRITRAQAVSRDLQARRAGEAVASAYAVGRLASQPALPFIALAFVGEPPGNGE